MTKTNVILSTLMKIGERASQPSRNATRSRQPTREQNPEGNVGDRSNSFTRLLGELQLIANVTRPDIAYAIDRSASYTANPSLQHIGALNRILQHLSSTRNHGIVYRALPPQPSFFLGCTDAPYGSTDGRKSVSHLIFEAEQLCSTESMLKSRRRKLRKHAKERKRRGKTKLSFADQNRPAHKRVWPL
jgi:hypothetical protein